MGRTKIPKNPELRTPEQREWMTARIKSAVKRRNKAREKRVRMLFARAGMTEDEMARLVRAFSTSESSLKFLCMMSEVTLLALNRKIAQTKDDLQLEMAVTAAEKKEDNRE